MPFSKDDPNINRKGRPMSGTTWAEIFKRIGEEVQKIKEHHITKKERLARELYKLAICGSLPASRIIMDREEGTPIQTQKITQEEDEEFIIVHKQYEDKKDGKIQ